MGPLNLARALLEVERFSEAKALLRKYVPKARRALGPSHPVMLALSEKLVQALYEDCAERPLDDYIADMTEAVEILAKDERTTRSVRGSDHPEAQRVADLLRRMRLRLKRARDQKSAAEIAADAEDARLAAEEDASCDSDTYSDSASGASEDEDDEGEDSASES